MNAEQFAMWLHGFFEISGVDDLDTHQTAIIKDHLALLFNKVTPDRTEKQGTPNTGPSVDLYNWSGVPYAGDLNKIIC